MADPLLALETDSEEEEAVWVDAAESDLLMAQGFVRRARSVAHGYVLADELADRVETAVLRDPARLAGRSPARLRELTRKQAQRLDLPAPPNDGGRRRRSATWGCGTTATAW